MKIDASRRGILTGRWRKASNGIRPPWSGDESHFLTHCTRCDACINACENNILQRGAGGYPSVNFKNNECSFCYACAQACPESLFSPRHTRAWDLQFTIGDACLAYQSVECRRCQDSCEPMAIIFRPTLSGIYQPQLNSQLCNGCGACAASCPVHAFASDPARGMFILAFMVLVIGGSLLLFAARGHKVRSRVNNALWSRESLLLANNVLLVAAMLVVLLGTLLPLVHKQLGLGSISIGEPFFNTMFTWLMVPFALLLGVGPLVRWGRDRPRKIRNLLIIAFISTLVLSLLLPWLFESKVVAMTVLGLAMACWIAVLAIAEAALRISRGTKTTFSYWGMVAAHLGLAVTIVGIAFSQNYSVERDVRMKSGDSVDIHEYRFTFRDVKEVTGPNWRGGVATIGVTREGKPETVLYAEKRYYNTAGSMMTEAAIDGGITRDLYAALGEELENGAWAVRLYYKPFVRWIWAGGLMMALGGLLCLFDPRYRKRVSPQKTAPEAV